MKKFTSILLAILLLLAAIFVVECKVFVRAETGMIIVPGDSPTIQEAINHANPGDTIFVKIGTYPENVVINKSVSLIGEDRNQVVIDANGTGSVIFVLASSVTVKGFTLKRSGEAPYDSGLRVEHSSGSIISNNVILSNYGGISLFSCSNNVVSGNIISDNYDGISLFASFRNVVSGNIISDNYDGIGFVSSPNNVISGNWIISNSYCGIGIVFSGNNIIYRNNFNNTPAQVRNDESINIWNYGSEGNYWSDYSGKDIDGDGIGDEPYDVDAYTQDMSPLMGMFFDFNVALERKFYEVTIISSATISDFGFGIGPETGNRIVHFNVTGEDNTTGFCRVMIPTELMNDTFVILVGEEEIMPTKLGISNEAYAYLYFTYIHHSQVVTIVSSKILSLYNEILGRYVKLQTDLYDLNETYYNLLNDNNVLLYNYSQLQESYRELNTSYQEHLLQYNENLGNFQNLVYIFAFLTAIFIITTVYLSNRAHTGIRTKNEISDDQNNG